MTSLWHRRLLGTVVLWFAAVAALGLAGMQPSVVVLAALAAAGAGALWVALDLADLAESVDWRPSGETASSSMGSDGRARAVRRQLGDQERFGADARLHAHLVDLLDERLTAAHGVSRTTDPARAAALLGPDLVAFVAAAPLDAGLTDPGRLATVITRIESIGADTVT
jgi:hypothetical protein